MRDVSLSKRAVELLSLLPMTDEGEPIFGISADTREVLFRKAMKLALVKGLTFHNSRHLASTKLSKKVGIRVLVRMVAHRDLQ